MSTLHSRRSLKKKKKKKKKIGGGGWQLAPRIPHPSVHQWQWWYIFYNFIRGAICILKARWFITKKNFWRLRNDFPLWRYDHESIFRKFQNMAPEWRHDNLVTLKRLLSLLMTMTYDCHIIFLFLFCKNVLHPWQMRMQRHVCQFKPVEQVNCIHNYFLIIMYGEILEIGGKSMYRITSFS